MNDPGGNETFPEMGTPIYIDTHAHLYDEAFAQDLDEVLLRAAEAGVAGFVLPAVDDASQDRLEETADRYPDRCFPCTGLHPTSVGADWKKELDAVERRLGQRTYHAVGEIGLDGYWSREYMVQQQEAFAVQLEWAAEAGLTAIVHLREATEALFEVLDRFRNSGRRLPCCVFHAFSGSPETFRRLITYGDFYFGIGGTCTYRNSSLPETLRRIPPERIVLETDCPWLPPVPHRGKRNEPAFLVHTAELTARATGQTPEELARSTTGNARRIFRLPATPGHTDNPS